jgi:hypothetical protein
MSRPDVSFYLAHFTSSKYPKGYMSDNNPTNEYKYLSPLKRLENILQEKKIKASILPWTGKQAVCLTECPWTSLIDHTKQYSPYGIGFNKKFIFVAGGAPAYYVRADYFRHQEWSDYALTFVTPFWPQYAAVKKKRELGFKICDYTHEREWRVPHDLDFEYSDIEFIVLKNYEDMAKFPKELKDEIGREKFLLMDNYTKVEELWPVHKF